MSATPQGTALVQIVSPKDTVLRCAFPDGVELHGCVQNVLRLQVEGNQIIMVKHPSDVLTDILVGLQALHRESKLIVSGKIERRLLELQVCSADLLDRALAPIIVALNGNLLRVSYKNYHARLVAAFA